MLGLLLLAAFISKGQPDARTMEAVSVLKDTDYPPESVRLREQGTVEMQLSIDAKGRVERCEIVTSSGFPRLDSKSCEVLQTRARFTPARDAAGKAVADRFTQRIKWVLPRNDVLSGDSRQIELSIDAKRKIVSCKDSLAEHVYPKGIYTPDGSAFQPMIDFLHERAPAAMPDHEASIVLETITDFGEQDMPVPELPGGKLIGEDLVRFDVDDTTRHFVACEVVSHQGSLPPAQLCKGGPPVMLPPGQTLGADAPHSGTVRGRVWVRIAH